MRVHGKLARLASILMYFFCLTTAQRGFAAPTVALGVQGGAFLSRTSLNGLNPAIQPGWDMKIAGIIESSDVFAFNADAASTGGALIAAFSGRLQADFFGFGSSLPQADGNLYRAWQGVGLSILGGVRTKAFTLPFGLRASARVEAGAGLRATKYSGTGLVSANTAILGQAGLDILVSKNIALGMAFPLEYALKSGGRAFMFGLGGAVRYR